MLRAIGLSLFLLVGIGIAVPFVSDYAEAGAHKVRRHKKKHRKYKKYSKQWWRAYYRRQERNNALTAQRRLLRLRQIRLANAVRDAENGGGKSSFMMKASRDASAQNSMPALLPSGEDAPKGWKQGAKTANELQFRVEDESGSALGAASISVVGPATGADVENSRVKTVGGVSTDSLRRTVIDRMVKEEGWVVNDYRKDIGGRKVFVVVAQSPGAGGKVQSRLFYFTEVDGRVYSVATSSPNENSRRVEQESEQVVTSLQRRKAVQEAVNR